MIPLFSISFISTSPVPIMYPFRVRILLLIHALIPILDSTPIKTVPADVVPAAFYIYCIFDSFPMNSSIVAEVAEEIPSRFTNATITLSHMIFRSPKNVI